MGPDRRRPKWPRLQVRLPVVTQPVEITDEAVTGEAEDLSVCGMRLHQKKAAAPGATVLVTLRLRRYLAVCMLGTVVWAQPHPNSEGWHLGIMFAGELNEKAVTEIANPDVLLRDVSGGA
jgi:PilZ domain-containing protein